MAWRTSKLRGLSTVLVGLAATGGVLLLGEHLTMRLLGAGSALLCGVLLALATRWRKSLEMTKELR